MAFIVSLISTAILEVLEAAFDVDDNTGSELVRLGRLMEDPETYNNPILVHENDPDSPDSWLHEQLANVYGTPEQPQYFSIGGSESWARRFTVDLMVYLTRERLERVEAKTVMDTIHGRALHALRNATSIQGITDEYGETVWLARNCVAKSRMVVTGGPESWIGRGKLWIQVLTEIP